MNKHLLSLPFLCLLAALMLFSAACETDPGDDDAADTGATDTTDTADMDEEDTTIILDYRFVRVTDMSGATGGDDPGADIDAIFITKAAGGDVFPSSVPEYMATPSDVVAADPNAILTLDAFTAGDTSTCALEDGSGNPTYVSLGGGGYIIAQFDSPGIEEGDTVNVYEVGNCDFGGGDAIADSVNVEISVGQDTTGVWQTISTGDQNLHQVEITSAMIPPVEAAP